MIIKCLRCRYWAWSAEQNAKVCTCPDSDYLGLRMFPTDWCRNFDDNADQDDALSDGANASGCRDSIGDRNKGDGYKLPLTMVPRKIIWGIAATRLFGIIKYPLTGVDGWREIGKERLRDAMMRHMMEYLDNPTGCAEDSQIPSLYHLAFNVAALCELENLPLPTPELIAEWRETYKGAQEDV